ncbi:mucin-13-like [Antechinus flavipes]|uniref:mucin-13-like n=1 Tax=Antechinus flavipes TaxID=38775 RepID=UPI002236A676|nr:mucin-13-like [Antechinus flavipes]
MLIFTVVCVIGGVILLGTIIGLIVLARSKKKGKSGEEDSLINRDFSNVRLETTGFNNPAMSSGGLFPKVNVAQFSKNQSNVKSNPYEDPHEDPYFRRPMPTRDY